MDEEDIERMASPTDSLVDNEYPSPTDGQSFDYVRSDSVGSTTELIFHKVNFSVEISKGCCKSTQKQILKEVSGIMRPGVNAILGPTGSGKTTLLDVLAGRTDKKLLDGHILVNGEPQSENFQLQSGFVSQDDIIMGTLTIRENLNFSAALRLPRKYSTKERQARVQMIIEDLGLTACSETRVGDDEMRGVSGGERKRCNIGMELITQPNVLFLDEPTTGLDASTASSVIKLLRKQGKKGRTIIFSIHQPRFSIFKLFDDITLLSLGQIVYKGSTKQSLGYFETLGYRCEVYNNPADFFLDVIVKEEQKKHVAVLMQDGVVVDEQGDEEQPAAQNHGMIAEHFKTSKLYKETILEIQPTMDMLNGNGKVHYENTGVPTYERRFYEQIFIVSKRTTLNLLRDPRSLTTQAAVSLINALVIGAIYWQIGLGASGLDNRVGAFFFMITNSIFSNLSAVALFIKERPIFRHECANGYYRVSSFFFSKIICDILPMRVIPLLIFAAISYFMIGFTSAVDKFFIFTFTLLMSSLAAASVCMFVSSSVNLLAVANLLCSLPFVFMMIFSGFLVNLSSVPVWLRWLKYLSIFRYGLSSLEINELHGMTFHCNATEICPSGDDYLNKVGIDINNLWINIIALAAIFVGLLTATYIQLRRIKK